MEWLHAGYKGLVLDDEDDDFIAHFLMDTPQTLFLPGIPLTGFCFSNTYHFINIVSPIRNCYFQKKIVSQNVK